MLHCNRQIAAMQTNPLFLASGIPKLFPDDEPADRCAPTKGDTIVQDCRYYAGAFQYPVRPLPGAARPALDEERRDIQPQRRPPPFRPLRLTNPASSVSLLSFQDTIRNCTFVQWPRFSRPFFLGWTTLLSGHPGVCGICARYRTTACTLAYRIPIWPPGSARQKQKRIGREWSYDGYGAGNGPRSRSCQ